MKIKLILSVVLGVILFCSLPAEVSSIDPDFYSYGARATAMGSAYTSLTASPLACIWNPAGLNRSRRDNDFLVDHTNLLDLVSFNFAGYSRRIGKDMTAALAATYNGDEALAEINIYLALAVSARTMMNIFNRDPEGWERLNLGLSMRYIGFNFGNNPSGSFVDENGLEHQVKGNASGYGLNLGLHYEFNDRNRIGILGRNLLNEIWWESRNQIGTALGSYREKRTPYLKLGYSTDFRDLTISLDYGSGFTDDAEDRIFLGSEYFLFNRLLSLRTGYSQEVYTSDNKQFALGTGFEFDLGRSTRIRIDISYRIMAVWEGHNYLGVSCSLLK